MSHWHKLCVTPWVPWDPSLVEEKDTNEFIIMVCDQSFVANLQGQMVWHHDNADDNYEREVRKDFSKKMAF